MSNFNKYNEDVRVKLESLTKQIIFLSGGIQTLTISAFLSGKKIGIDQVGVNFLQNGWIFLTISIICGLLFMFILIVAMLQVTNKMKNVMKSSNKDDELQKLYEPHIAFIVISWALGIVGFFSCIAGIYFVSRAAILIISKSVV